MRREARDLSADVNDCVRRRKVAVPGLEKVGRHGNSRLARCQMDWNVLHAAVSGMSFIRVLLPIAVGLAGCSSTYQVVQVPQREADLYPLSETRQGVSVAVDEITSSDRAASYFGADLLRVGIVPLVVVISNNGAHRIDVKPADILLTRGMQIIDPLRLEAVVATAKKQHGPVSSTTQKSLARYFEGLAFSEMVLPPGGTYQGVMFFPLPRQTVAPDSMFSAMTLFHESGMWIQVGARDLDTGRRVRFGPFSVSSPPSTAQ
jgi:hypothetical protein